MKNIVVLNGAARKNGNSWKNRGTVLGSEKIEAARNLGSSLCV